MKKKIPERIVDAYIVGLFRDIHINVRIYASNTDRPVKQGFHKGIDRGVLCADLASELNEAQRYAIDGLRLTDRYTGISGYANLKKDLKKEEALFIYGFAKGLADSLEIILLKNVVENIHRALIQVELQESYNEQQNWQAELAEARSNKQ